MSAPSSSQRTPSVPTPIGASPSALWDLDPGYVFLNHGSFGAVPRAVQQACTAARIRMESRPIELLGRRIGELLEPSRQAVGDFLGMSRESFGFVANATEGINSVLRSLDFEPGDELLATTHVYNAIRKAMTFRARQCGAAYREVPLELPLQHPHEALAAMVGALTNRTRLVVVDQITSPTALMLPVRELAHECRSRGIELLVDGAHAPGMVPLNVPELGATYWTGNLHKWCCAPKTVGVLWVDAARQRSIHPATVSHFLDEGLNAEFEWQGTRDIAPWMTAGAAIQFMGQWGWERVRAHNHALAAWAHKLLCERWEVDPLSPLDGSMLGSMCTVPLPAEVRARFTAPDELAAALYNDHRIEVPIVEFEHRWHVRASAQIYNRADHYEALAQAVLEYSRHA